eukprot:PLAT12522.14.p1 GENE.PLAT12522.14~~PLAT12522.14.p1  ORF type:complete len:393 (+),score=112.20 PLAT12522.14:58-1179(+)
MGAGGAARSSQWPMMAVVLVLFASAAYINVSFCLPAVTGSVAGSWEGRLLMGGALLSFVAYVVAAGTDSGTVPQDCDVSAAGWADELNLHRVDGERGVAKFCRRCDAPKPERCHHCRICDRCVLRMDHHCKWLGTCVGSGNYKPFVLFLIYTVLTGLHALSLQLRYLLAPPPASWPVPALLIGAFTLVLGCIIFAVAALLAWHLFLISKNSTTIEYYLIRRNRRRQKAGQATEGITSFVYHQGLLNNVLAVLGSNPLLWPVPLPLRRPPPPPARAHYTALPTMSTADEEMGLLPRADERAGGVTAAVDSVAAVMGQAVTSTVAAATAEAVAGSVAAGSGGAGSGGASGPTGSGGGGMIARLRRTIRPSAADRL